ncbi:protein wntless homolog isoform X5 [Oncorhynchus keta]|uniref:protein wntless homolog isoform X5 n=1 Tax=Oncorhynchus keta TaxID=8018 RepID=UPI002279FFC9|nr:protein wntless homolog isoform X5 [Oncorhynchus keta]
MAGAIIENMSTKKLVIVGVILLLFQAFSFMVGGLIAPSPTTAVHYLATKCVDAVKRHQSGRWFMPWGPNQCDKIQDFDEAMSKKIEANNIVFAVHIPLPNKEMSPWFQFMLVILQFDIAFKMYNQIEDGAVATIDVGVAYRDDMLSEWTEMAHSIERRKLCCNFTTTKVNTGHWSVPTVPFPLGLNTSPPPRRMRTRGATTSVTCCPSWNWATWPTSTTCSTSACPSANAIRSTWASGRSRTSVWWVIFALGLCMTFINIPVEWFSVGFNWTWMLLFGDIRQGIFYAMLLSFWIIFCGEHLMDHVERNRFSIYWKQVGPIVFGSFCLFIFDMCERFSATISDVLVFPTRGVQLKNPFYSIWASDVGTELAMAFIIVAGICACLYFLFLCFMVFQVFRNISGKRSSLPAMSKARRLHYEGLIFRFKFLMLVTLTCAAMTVIFFIISQVNEGHWHWGDYMVQVNSAFFTGIYGMWNLYVFAIMFLYAPSHKRYGDEQSRGASGEDIQLTTTITHVDGPTEIYKMTGKEAQE